MICVWSTQIRRLTRKSDNHYSQCLNAFTWWKTFYDFIDLFSYTHLRIAPFLLITGKCNQKKDSAQSYEILTTNPCIVPESFQCLSASFRLSAIFWKSLKRLISLRFSDSPDQRGAPPHLKRQLVGITAFWRVRFSFYPNFYPNLPQLIF